MVAYQNKTEEQKDAMKEASKKWYHNNKERSKLTNAAWRSNNKQYVLEKQRLQKRQRKEWAIEYLGGRCCSCGNTYHPSIYEFHHVNPEDRDPSKMMMLSLKRLQEELDKCNLLCANCHRFLHHGNY
jgi:methionyl-tRNA synthetase